MKTEKLFGLFLMMVGILGELFSLFIIAFDISHWAAFDYLPPYYDRELPMLLLATFFLAMSIAGAMLCFYKKH